MLRRNTCLPAASADWERNRRRSRAPVAAQMPVARSAASVRLANFACQSPACLFFVVADASRWRLWLHVPAVSWPIRLPRMAAHGYKMAPPAIGLSMSSRYLRYLRSFLFALAAYSSLNGPASAVYPDRIIKIVVPFAPGGGTDVVARTLAQEMA